MTQHSDDSSRRPVNGPGLEQDLEALKAAWSDLEPVDPPGLLDRAVLNAARRHLPGPAEPPLRWGAWLATAAVAIMAIGLLIRQPEELPSPGIAEDLGLQRDESGRAERRVDAPKPAAEHEPESALRITGKSTRPAMAREEPAVTLQQAEAPLEMAADAAAAGEPTARRTAEDWIEQLLMLKRDGRLDELDRELGAFRKAYPDYRLPPELED